MTDRKPIVITATGGSAEMPTGDTLPVGILPLRTNYYQAAINAAFPNGVDAIYGSVVDGKPGHATTIAFYAPDAPPGGPFDNLVSQWLQLATTASPPGQGLSSTSSPTLAATMASLRSQAFMLQTGANVATAAAPVPISSALYKLGMIQWGQALATPIANAASAMAQAVVDPDPNVSSNIVWNAGPAGAMLDALFTSWLTMSTTPTSGASPQAYGLGYTSAQALAAVTTVRANAAALAASF